jgi:hypothetical protein
MRKFKLDLDALTVDTLETTPQRHRDAGTVAGYDSGTDNTFVLICDPTSPFTCPVLCGGGGTTATDAPTCGLSCNDTCPRPCHV